ncbi:hypothetical protein MJO28_003518 [Puccinia striiformis f. sp. tritici]|uniref:Uncharacterized protein n=4 Tax=Puccinia striiformis TaxID=27350 RepID=A0A0L0VAZ3_9BASI|nr:hypothetical protein Pst134EB_005646 [Puccinia striiformis f. sp. tritici]KAI9613310.1 hypothetical protein H4Q26_009910 [Puccinia striiformis f. sp. tritici PST-130]KNE96159.1 hypothetical protein PSTG_10577 [Puccinia striiformis f. sp. tritici PST-78]POW00037.1 hypothetical protein PSHT_13274 [Puccinia striiformis]KAI7959727.1 hypothetical protein MJO28_003518 [Puccinia striiformis f. sp. tritici]
MEAHGHAHGSDPNQQSVTGDTGANYQHGATRLKDENVIVHPEGSMTQVAETETHVPFKAKVEGYAKKFAGKTFGKEHEVAAGEARLRGEDQPKHYKQ